MFNSISDLKSIEEYYLKYLKDPKSVDSSWEHFFDGMDFALSSALEKEEGDIRVFHLILFYRTFGHFYAHVNPLKEPIAFDFKKLGFTQEDLDRLFFTYGYLKEKKAPLKKILESLKVTYGERIGFEYLHCDQKLVEWIQQKIEPNLKILTSKEETLFILNQLNKAEVLESFLNTKFPGQKRFSLEGAETLIPMLSMVLEKDIAEIVIGMSHRGRINVLANIAQKPYSIIFYEFQEGYVPFSYENEGDVKYHKGYSSDVQTKNKKVRVIIPSNPSHLESINAIALGQTFAYQQKKEDKKHILPLLIHGDASFAGQGIIYESLQMMNLPEYTTDGSLHIIVNNQIGFTTFPHEGKSTANCTDIAKTFQIPILHVNAEDPESCIFAINLAFEIRRQFQIDVLIDLICYRKYGHNEGDEPAFTQPVEYAIIRKKKTIRSLYIDQLKSENLFEEKIFEQIENEFKQTLQKELEKSKEYSNKEPEPEKMLGVLFTKKNEESLLNEVDTKVDHDTLKKVINRYCQIPDGFNIHIKLEKWLSQRKEIVKKELSIPSIDWSLSELLAFGSLLMQKYPVRLAGQDSERGTFNQRHDVWIDQKTSKPYFPLDHLSENQAKCMILNTTLSEYAALGFEYGYSLAFSNALVMWEAQFGDFCNAAQVILDQYIASAEDKWSLFSPITLLLPHGYEGQGPEHSSARIERFLQLCANNNMQIVNPSTPSQYFHVLRRQVIRKLKKPLIIFTPKSLLRHPLCQSAMKDFIDGSFKEIIDDDKKSPSRRVLLCSGKIYYDLITEKENKKYDHVSILRIEQLYPFHIEKFKKILEKYQSVQEWFWVQEEPKNMGAYEHIKSQLNELIKTEIKYVGRKESATPSEGSHLQHKEKMKMIIDEALS